ncbi:CaiB/BaiF CoA transferase family protein [Variovorax sp. RA8]|uniref:CaiB/BaiF CoA transferase family protein n=1 Tax=Variovorax sp. (strain JCM 16519 / RA8) TaxID=662548 RepID=UPI0013187800|nr:CoA transferase [Variovorax sp. RA8]VTU31805.1 Bile acid-CoA hydrolase [Variovorax sp. RA8]
MHSAQHHAASIAQTPAPAAQGPLAGIRILDMATVIAAPFSASLCADMGAEVVKLELPEGNDPLRSLSPTTPDHALFWKVSNRGKKGVSLDVRKPEGRALFLRLIETFDVLVENFRTGTLDKWGLDAATLWSVNPRLIILRVTGFGQTGPYAQRPGFARIFEAMSGFAHLTGESGRSPQHMNYPLGDVIAGLFGAFSIATAIAERHCHPDAPGREIDLAATEAMFRLLEALPVEHELLGQARSRSGSRATYTAPSNMYRTADDQWVTLVGSSDPIFKRICQAMGQPALADDVRFATTPARVLNIDEIDTIVAAWCASRTLAELSEALTLGGVPYSKVYAVDDVIADPHFIAREAIIRLPDPDLGSLPAPAIVPRFSGFNPVAPRTGPATGEHNAGIYGALGLRSQELDELQRNKVI